MCRLLLISLALFAMTTAVGLQPIACGAEADSTCECRQCLGCACTTRGSWFVAETENFSVWSRQSQHAAADVATHCENLRHKLHHAWNSAEAAPWTPKCAVVVHAGLAEYRGEFGADEDAVGCTTITRDDDRVVFRRIDLRADATDWRINALSHELTHVVIADLLSVPQLPHWLNEGLAMLSESDDLLARRAAVLADAHQRGTLPEFHLHVNERSLGAAADAEVRYAMSASLVAHLDSLGGREQLLKFAEQTARDGCETALRELYGMSGGVTEWERRWQAALTAEPTPFAIR